MNKRKFKADHFKNMEELLNTIESWLSEDNIYYLYDDFNRWFDSGAMEEMYYLIRKQEEVIEKVCNYCYSEIDKCKYEQSDDEWECCIEELEGVLLILEDKEV